MDYHLVCDGGGGRGGLVSMCVCEDGLGGRVLN